MKKQDIHLGLLLLLGLTVLGVLASPFSDLSLVQRNIVDEETVKETQIAQVGGVWDQNCVLVAGQEPQNGDFEQWFANGIPIEITFNQFANDDDSEVCFWKSIGSGPNIQLEDENSFARLYYVRHSLGFHGSTFITYQFENPLEVGEYTLSFKAKGVEGPYGAQVPVGLFAFLGSQEIPGNPQYAYGAFQFNSNAEQAYFINAQPVTLYLSSSNEFEYPTENDEWQEFFVEFTVSEEGLDTLYFSTVGYSPDWPYTAGGKMRGYVGLDDVVLNSVYIPEPFDDPISVPDDGSYEFPCKETDRLWYARKARLSVTRDIYPDEYCADLRIVKEIIDDSLSTADRFITYRIFVTNFGPHPAHNIHIKENFPSDFLFTSWSGEVEAGAYSGTNDDYYISTLDAGETTHIDITVEVPSVACGFVHTNTAYLEDFAGIDYNQSNNQDSAAMYVPACPKWDGLFSVPIRKK